MAFETFEVKGKHNCVLKGLRTVPKKKPKAILQIFHGMGEHKERYIPFMEFMTENGYACYIHDHRKHGGSVTIEDGYGLFDAGDRWDNVLDDAYFVSRKIMKDFPGTKIIVMGHSMGSIIARTFISRNALLPHAAIIMGTLPPISPIKAVVPKFLARTIDLFTPKYKRSNFLANLLNKPLLKNYNHPKTKFDWITSDEEVVKQYEDDPLCGYAYTPKFYLEFFKAIVEASNSNVISHTKDNPILFISGKDDPVGEYGSGVDEIHRIYLGHGFTSTTIKLVDGARHEVLNEKNKEETYQFIVDWCNKTLSEEGK
jgi:alpha-beta hydrolase superfamily lysophospholipase